MKRIGLFALIISFILPLIMLAPAMAEDAPDETDQFSEEDRKAATDARIEERKAARQLSLEELRMRLIESRCSQAQNRLGVIIEKVSTAYSRRITAYENMTDKLDGLLLRLEEAGINVAELSSDVTALKLMLSNFTALFDDYLQVLDDLEAMDCAADPTGFHTSLVVARENVSELKILIEEIHEFFKTEIRQSFQDAIAQLGTAIDETLTEEASE